MHVVLPQARSREKDLANIVTSEEFLELDERRNTDENHPLVAIHPGLCDLSVLARGKYISRKAAKTLSVRSITLKSTSNA